MLTPAEVRALLTAVKDRVRERQRRRRAEMGPECRREEWRRHQAAARRVAA